MQRHCVSEAERRCVFIMRISVGGAASIPIRLQLTLALVALVAAASAALIYTSYRTMVRSVTDEAVNSVQAARKSVV